MYTHTLAGHPFKFEYIYTRTYLNIYTYVYTPWQGIHSNFIDAGFTPSTVLKRARAGKPCMYVCMYVCVYVCMCVRET